MTSIARNILRRARTWVPIVVESMPGKNVAAAGPTRLASLVPPPARMPQPKRRARRRRSPLRDRALPRPARAQPGGLDASGGQAPPKLSALAVLAVGFAVVISDPAMARAEQEFIQIGKTSRSFVCQSSGKPFVPWGFNYDHDEQGRLIEDYW